MAQPAPAIGCPRPIMRFVVRGGLSNQKECLINAAIVAHALNVTLALPHLDLIGRGNERFEPADAKYVGPYADRSRWGHFAHLFNASHFTRALEGQVLMIHRLRLVVGSGKPHTVRLPSEFVVEQCPSRWKVQRTCEARQGDPSLLNELIARWRRVVRADCERGTSEDEGSSWGARQAASSTKGVSPIQLRPGTPPLVSPRATVFDAGQSLCWNAYKSRFATVCASHFPICNPLLRALRWNRHIERLQSRVLQGISNIVANTSVSSTFVPWVAVHVRAFVCARNSRTPTFGHVVAALRRQGITSGVLYLVSSVQLTEVQRALPHFNVVGKSTFLGESVRLHYPFEVLAAIDYGIATMAPIYMGEPTMSSFDAFASEERVRRQLGEVEDIPSTCGSNAFDLDAALKEPIRQGGAVALVPSTGVGRMHGVR